jgi:hypothetical protein
MPNKKINQLDSRTAVSTDLMLVGDPTNGTAYKSTVANLPLVPTSRVLTINGVSFDLSANRAWTIDALPSQTGNSGKYLTTNGTVASWGTINLSGYVPYTGATQAVNLGAFDLLVQGLTIGKGTGALANNTALGYQSIYHATTGNYNTGVGYQSLHNISTGQYNTALGQSSMFTATTAAQNVAIGLNALLYTTSGGSNVVVGLDGLMHNTTGSSNTAIGYNAGTHITGGATPNTTASNSVFIGRDSKAAADGQTNQIVIGQNAVGNGSNTATFGNTATTANYFTGSVNAGSFVKSGGTSAQFLKADGSIDSNTYAAGNIYTVNGTLTGNRTVTMGVNTLTFEKDIFIRDLRLGTGATGSNTNTGFGYQIFQSLTSGIRNVGIGFNVLFGNTSGTDNVAVGHSAMQSNGAGNENTACGRVALSSNFSGSGNSGFGNQALSLNQTGSNNVAIGNYAGFQIASLAANTIANQSIFIGNNTKALANNQTNQIVIGYNTTGLGSNTTIIGNSSTTDTAIYGRMLVNYATPVLGTFALDVNGTARVSGNATINGSIFLSSTSNVIAGAVGDGLYLQGQTRTYFYTGTNTFFARGFNGALLVGTTASASDPNASAVLQADSTTKGFLPPRMTSTQKNAISSPAQGLMVFDTTLVKLCVYNGTTWETITSV